MRLKIPSLTTVTSRQLQIRKNYKQQLPLSVLTKKSTTLLPVRQPLSNA